MISKENYIDAIAIIFTYILAVIFLLHPMLSTPLLPGIDGPYYAVQVRWLVERGELKYADPPLAFLLLTAFYLVLGDLFLAVKLGSVLLTSLAVLPIYLLVKRLTSSRIAGIAAGLAFAINPFTLKLYSDFIKNSIGLLWLNLFLLFEIRYMQDSSRKNLVGLIVALVLTALTHILDYGVALFYAISLFSLSIPFTRDIKKALPGAAIAFLSFAGLVAAPWVVGGDIRKGFAFITQLAESDLEPVVMQQHWFILALAISAALFAKSYFSRDNSEMAMLCIASGILAILVNLPILPRNWLFRFRLMTNIPLAYAVGMALTSKKEGENLVAAILILALLLVISLPATGVVRPSIPPPAYQELKDAIAKCEATVGKARIPDVRLRYWAETISDNVEGASRGNTLGNSCLVFLKTRKPIHIPPGQKIYEGAYILALRPKKPGGP